MRAGILRHRVDIEHKHLTADAFGQPIETWLTLLAAEPAEVRDIRGREYWLAGQPAPVGEVTTRVRIRYRPGLDRLLRVRHGDARYEVQAVLDPDGRRTELHLMCKAMS